MAKSKPGAGARRRASLDGVTVFVARPVGRAAALVTRLSALGADAVHLPTASLRATDAPAAARAALAKAVSAYATVFTSATAVRHAAALAPALDWGEMRTIAVGPATAHALARLGADPVLPSLRFDSEGVLALRELAAVRGRRIVIVTAPGGRDAIARGLAARGARIEPALVYRRALPRWLARHRDAITTAGPRAALLVSSVDAIAALRALAGPAGFDALRRLRACASSVRVAEALRDAGFRQVRVARSALAHDLVDALVAEIERGRAAQR